jgi:NO-binding membrane sensor protein with MHYT domain
MSIDKYTKIILTIIALSLALIAVQMTIREAKAQQYSSSSGVQLVAICNMHRSPNGQMTCADVVDGGRLRVADR